MATERDTSLILSISADVRQVSRALQKMEQDTGRSTKNVERQFERMGRDVDRTVKGSFARVNQTIAGFGAGFARGAGGALLAGFSIQGAQRYIDAATRIQNALKVAGVEGDNLTKVYDRLFASAQKNAAPLETMVTLYSRVSQAQDSLGVSQEQILNFTDKVGVALRVAGTSAQEASGALLQLGQALGAGTVRAEEFNSINEGARPILQAVAAGLKEAGGSVAELRKLVLDGKVSSEAFFRAFEAGASSLESKVKSAELTVSQQFTRLQNVLIDVAGRFDDVTNVSGRVGAGFERLSGIIAGLGRLFEAVAGGPAGALISRLEQVNNLLKQFEPLSRGLDLLTGENLGAAADALTGTPAATGLSAQIAAKQEEIARLEEGLAKYEDAGVRAKVKDLQAEVAELQQDLRNAKEKEQIYTRSGASGPAGGTVRNPVSLNDYPVGGADAGGGGGFGGGRAASMIRGFEGFRERAYWDVNAWRIGFGSDTATRANGMIEKVTQDTIVTLQDAERDLTRRIVEFQMGIQNAIGIEKWKSLTEAQQAALTSIAYNYGSIGPGGANIADIVRTGSHGQVANAIAGLSANPERRAQEAQAFGGASVSTTNVAAVQQATDAWSGLRDQTQQTAVATQQVQQEYSVLQNVGVTALNGLKNALADGKLEGKELLGILFDIVQQLIQAQSAAGGISFAGAGAGGGGVGSILGSLFGFEKGGIAARGKPLRTFSKGGVSRSAAIFGEAGPEAAVPLPDGRSIPVTLNMPKMPRKDAAAQRPQQTQIVVNVAGANGDQHVIDLVRQGVQQGIGQYDRNMPGRVMEISERNMR